MGKTNPSLQKGAELKSEVSSSHCSALSVHTREEHKDSGLKEKQSNRMKSSYLAAVPDPLE